MSVRWASLGGWSLPQDASPGMLRVKNASRKCFSKCLLKERLAFIFEEAPFVSSSSRFYFSFSPILSLSPLYIFWVHLLQDCYPLFYFHHEMMGKSMTQFWRTSDYLKPIVCSTKVKQRNQRIQNTLTL